MKPIFHPRKSAIGFTLVELLVVVTIIVVLVSILIPAMEGAVHQAAIAKCGSNLRQCGSAVIRYGMDNNGFLYTIDLTNSNKNQHYGANMFARKSSNPASAFDVRPPMKPYVETFKLWLCPAMRDPPPIDDPRNTRNLAYCTYFYFPLDYQENLRLGPAREPAVRRLGHGHSAAPLMQDVFADATRIAGFDGWISNHATGGKYIFGTDDGKNPSGHGIIVPDRSSTHSANVARLDAAVINVPAFDLLDVGTYKDLTYYSQ